MGAAGWREEPLQEPEVPVSARRGAGPELEAGGGAGRRARKGPWRRSGPEDAPSERARAAVRGEGGARRRVEGAGRGAVGGTCGRGAAGRDSKRGLRGAEGAGVRAPACALRPARSRSVSGACGRAGPRDLSFAFQAVEPLQAGSGPS